MIKFVRRIRGLFPVKKRVLEKVPEVKPFKKKRGGKNVKKSGH